MLTVAAVCLSFCFLTFANSSQAATKTIKDLIVKSTDSSDHTIKAVKDGHTYNYIYGHFADLATVINWNFVVDHASPPPDWQPTGGLAFNGTIRAMLLDKVFLF